MFYGFNVALFVLRRNNYENPFNHYFLDNVFFLLFINDCGEQVCK